ncbi:RPT1 ATP-dependent 26S proteasome regulatory subunit [Fimbriimonadaceae bacterium]
MNADLLKCLFTAVQLRSDRDLVAVCQRIVADERRRGHEKLAAELEKSLQESGEPSSKKSVPSSFGLKPLPSNRREAAPLVHVLEHSKLRHHMVLPAYVEEQLAMIEREFAARSRLATYGLQATRKVLLYGPPGCGKSLSAERLAWSTGHSLHKVRFDTLISSFFGETATNLQRVFESAEREPCALFFDECDTIALARGRRNEVGEASRVVNMLLQLMEDYRGDGMIIAATNLYEGLDKAIYRRFDATVEIPLPGFDEVVRLLEVTLSALDVDRSFRYDSFARSLDGFSCSEIEKIAQKAAKRCVMAGQSRITELDLEASAKETRRHS